MSLTKVRRGKGSLRVGGTRLVVFPRPNHPQFKKATSRDPLEPGPLALPLPKEVQGGGGGGPGRKGGPGSKGSSACTGSRSVGIPRAGSPNEPGPLAFSHKVL